MIKNDRWIIEQSWAGHQNGLDGDRSGLFYAKRKDIKEAYDSAISLLSNLESSLTDHFLEVLAIGVAYARKIPAKDRLELVVKIKDVAKSCSSKMEVIDALVIVAEDLEDLSKVKEVLGSFVEDEDTRVRVYAKDALLEIGKLDLQLPDLARRLTIPPDIDLPGIPSWILED